MIKFNQTRKGLWLGRSLCCCCFLIVLIVQTVCVYGQARDHCGASTNSIERDGFHFYKFGRSSGLENCVNSCCGEERCEIAFLLGLRCFGLACRDPEVCHRVADQLVTAHDQRIHEDYSKHHQTTSGIQEQSVLASSPKCPRPFATSFTFPISDSSRQSKKFEVLFNGTITENDCADLCCKTPGCNVGFVEESACYGVSFRKASKYYHTDNAKKDGTMSLTMAIIDRKREVSRSVDETEDINDEDEKDERFIDDKNKLTSVDDEGDGGDDDDIGSETADSKIVLHKSNFSVKSVKPKPTSRRTAAERNTAHISDKKTSPRIDLKGSQTKSQPSRSTKQSTSNNRMHEAQQRKNGQVLNITTEVSLQSSSLQHSARIRNATGHVLNRAKAKITNHIFSKAGNSKMVSGKSDSISRGYQNVLKNSTGMVGSGQRMNQFKTRVNESVSSNPSNHANSSHRETVLAPITSNHKQMSHGTKSVPKPLLHNETGTTSKHFDDSSHHNDGIKQQNTNAHVSLPGNAARSAFLNQVNTNTTAVKDHPARYKAVEEIHFNNSMKDTSHDTVRKVVQSSNNSELHHTRDGRLNNTTAGNTVKKMKVNEEQKDHGQVKSNTSETSPVQTKVGKKHLLVEHSVGANTSWDEKDTNNERPSHIITQSPALVKNNNNKSTLVNQTSKEILQANHSTSLTVEKQGHIHKNQTMKQDDSGNSTQAVHQLLTNETIHKLHLNATSKIVDVGNETIGEDRPHVEETSANPQDKDILHAMNNTLTTTQMGDEKKSTDGRPREVQTVNTFHNKQTSDTLHKATPVMEHHLHPNGTRLFVNQTRKGKTFENETLKQHPHETPNVDQMQTNDTINMPPQTDQTRRHMDMNGTMKQNAAFQINNTQIDTKKHHKTVNRLHTNASQHSGGEGLSKGRLHTRVKANKTEYHVELINTTRKEYSTKFAGTRQNGGNNSKLLNISKTTAHSSKGRIPQHTNVSVGKGTVLRSSVVVLHTIPSHRKEDDKTQQPPVEVDTNSDDKKGHNETTKNVTSATTSAVKPKTKNAFRPTVKRDITALEKAGTRKNTKIYSHGININAQNKSRQRLMNHTSEPVTLTTKSQQSLKTKPANPVKKTSGMKAKKTGTLIVNNAKPIPENRKFAQKERNQESHRARPQQKSSKSLNSLIDADDANDPDELGADDDVQIYARVHDAPKLSKPTVTPRPSVKIPSNSSSKITGKETSIGKTIVLSKGRLTPPGNRSHEKDAESNHTVNLPAKSKVAVSLSKEEKKKPAKSTVHLKMKTNEDPDDLGADDEDIQIYANQNYMPPTATTAKKTPSGTASVAPKPKQNFKKKQIQGKAASENKIKSISNKTDKNLEKKLHHAYNNSSKNSLRTIKTFDEKKVSSKNRTKSSSFSTNDNPTTVQNSHVQEHKGDLGTSNNHSNNETSSHLKEVTNVTFIHLKAEVTRNKTKDLKSRNPLQATKQTLKSSKGSGITKVLEGRHVANSTKNSSRHSKPDMSKTEFQARKTKIAINGQDVRPKLMKNETYRPRGKTLENGRQHVKVVENSKALPNNSKIQAKKQSNKRKYHSDVASAVVEKSKQQPIGISKNKEDKNRKQDKFKTSASNKKQKKTKVKVGNHIEKLKKSSHKSEHHSRKLATFKKKKTNGKSVEKVVVHKNVQQGRKAKKESKVLDSFKKQLAHSKMKNKLYPISKIPLRSNHVKIIPSESSGVGDYSDVVAEEAVFKTPRKMFVYPKNDSNASQAKAVAKKMLPSHKNATVNSTTHVSIKHPNKVVINPPNDTKGHFYKAVHDDTTGYMENTDKKIIKVEEHKNLGHGVASKHTGNVNNTHLSHTEAKVQTPKAEIKRILLQNITVSLNKTRSFLPLSHNNTSVASKIYELRNPLLHHIQNVSGSQQDNVQFSAESHKHKSKMHSNHHHHVGHMNPEDIGDSDFDILMSNDIPRKLKKETKKKTSKKKDKNDKKEKKAKKMQKVVVGEDSEEDDDDDTEKKSKPKKKMKTHKHHKSKDKGDKEPWFKGHIKYIKKIKDKDSNDNDDREDEQQKTRKHKKHEIVHHHHHHHHPPTEPNDDDDDNQKDKPVHYKKVQKDERKDDDDDDDNEEEHIVKHHHQKKQHVVHHHEKTEAHHESHHKFHEEESDDDDNNDDNEKQVKKPHHVKFVHHDDDDQDEEQDDQVHHKPKQHKEINHSDEEESNGMHKVHHHFHHKEEDEENNNDDHEEIRHKVFHRKHKPHVYHHKSDDDDDNDDRQQQHYHRFHHPMKPWHHYGREHYRHFKHLLKKTRVFLGEDAEGDDEDDDENDERNSGRHFKNHEYEDNKEDRRKEKWREEENEKKYKKEKEKEKFMKEYEKWLREHEKRKHKSHKHFEGTGSYEDDENQWHHKHREPDGNYASYEDDETKHFPFDREHNEWNEHDEPKPWEKESKDRGGPHEWKDKEHEYKHQHGGQEYYKEHEPFHSWDEKEHEEHKGFDRPWSDHTSHDEHKYEEWLPPWKQHDENNNFNQWGEKPHDYGPNEQGRWMDRMHPFGNEPKSTPWPMNKETTYNPYHQSTLPYHTPWNTVTSKPLPYAPTHSWNKASQGPNFNAWNQNYPGNGVGEKNGRSDIARRPPSNPAMPYNSMIPNVTKGQPLPQGQDNWNAGPGQTRGPSPSSLNQGVQGNQGLFGNKGNQGNQGIQGNQGVQGNQGSHGNQVNQYNRGVLGNQGSHGNEVNQNNQGVLGNQGSHGNEVNQNNQGILGNQGSHGNEVNQNNQGILGNQGNQTNQGIHRNQGIQGNTIMNNNMNSSFWSGNNVQNVPSVTQRPNPIQPPRVNAVNTNSAGNTNPNRSNEYVNANGGPNGVNQPTVKNGVPTKNLNTLKGFFRKETVGSSGSSIPVLGNQTLPTLGRPPPPETTSPPPPPPPPPLPVTTTTKPTTTPTTVLSTTHPTTPSTTPTKPTTPKPTTPKTTTPTPTQEDIPIPSPADADDIDGIEGIMGEEGSKHRKHRDPVCKAGRVTDDMTLLQGKRAGNFTKIGDVGDFELCIKRCCQSKSCNLAYKSGETCYLVHCHSKDSCQVTPALIKRYSPNMCFVRRAIDDEPEEQSDDDSNAEDDNDDDNDDDKNKTDNKDDDKTSPTGITEVCKAERALGIDWKRTSAGRYSTVPCPREAKGKARRKCGADSRWHTPEFSDCVTSDYLKIYEKSRKLAGADPAADSSPLIRELSQLTTQTLDNSLIFGGDLIKSTEAMSSVVQHNGRNDLLDMNRADMQNFVTTSSNLLDLTNKQEWINVQKKKPGSADILRSMEMFALQAAIRLPRDDIKKPFITNNIILNLDRRSARSGRLIFPDYSDSDVSKWDVRHDVISIPSSVFKRGEVSAASISFKSLPYLLPDANYSGGLGPNSKILSTILHPAPPDEISPPVTIILSHIKPKRANPKCVFWDYTINPHRGGGWSSRGCSLASSNDTHSVCQCSHLSNFALLADLSDDEISAKEQKRERTMALMWIGIPVLVVGVIGALYMSFSWTGKSQMSRQIDEKTGLLGQRVVTSQVREEFPASPNRHLHRALLPAYTPVPAGDLEWQDEFRHEMGISQGEKFSKQLYLPQLDELKMHLSKEYAKQFNTDPKSSLFTRIHSDHNKDTSLPLSPLSPTSSSFSWDSGYMSSSSTSLLSSIESSPSSLSLSSSRQTLCESEMGTGKTPTTTISETSSLPSQVPLISPSSSLSSLVVELPTDTQTTQENENSTSPLSSTSLESLESVASSSLESETLSSQLYERLQCDVNSSAVCRTDVTSLLNEAGLVQGSDSLEISEESNIFQTMLSSPLPRLSLSLGASLSSSLSPSVAARAALLTAASSPSPPPSTLSRLSSTRVSPTSSNDVHAARTTRVRFADEPLLWQYEDEEHDLRIQRLEQRVFAQRLTRSTGMSKLDMADAD